MWNGVETPHSAALSAELDWLDRVLNLRLEQHFQQRSEGLEAAEAPPAPPAGSELGRWVDRMRLGTEERLLLALALVPHLRRPQRHPNALTPTPWNLACPLHSRPPRQRLPSSLDIEGVSAQAPRCSSRKVR